MKLNFNRVNFFSSLLLNTTIAIIVMAYPKLSRASIPPTLTQIVRPMLQSVGDSSWGLRTRNINRLYPDPTTTHVPKEKEDQPPERKPDIGGSY